MRDNLYILWLGALFLLLLEVLQRVGFWTGTGLSEGEPWGMRWMGGLFLLLLFVMTQIFFKPYMAILEERDTQTVKKKEGAELTRKQADEMIQKYKEQIDATRLKAVSEREKRALQAENEESEILAKARKEGSQTVDAELTKVGAEADSALSDLKGNVKVFAEDIVNQVLYRESHSVSNTGKQIRAAS